MAPSRKPGETRERVYRFVRERLADGLPPTVREVQKAFGFKAVQTAREHLERLVTEGRLLKRTAGAARGYSLPAHDSVKVPSLMVPILGRVQAGALSAAVEDREGEIPVWAKSPDGLFCLRVRGDSMKDAGILNGDIVVVRSQPAADSGEIVVALVGDEATVKTLRIRRNRIELHPENPDFEPIIPPPDECSILGKVVEVRRFFETGGFRG